MKILFLTHEIPFPPNNGIRIVSYNAMLLMHEKGHDVCLCTITGEHSEANFDLTDRYGALSDIISPNSWWTKVAKRSRLTQIVDTARGKLTFIEQFKNKEFANKLLVTIKDFRPDVVHFDFINMTQYIDYLPAKIGSVASVNDCHTLTLQNRLATESYTGLQKWIKILQLARTRRYEIETYPRFGLTHLMTEVDAKFLREMNPLIRTRIIANGVDGELFTVKNANETSNDIVFVGKLFGNNLFSLKRFVEDGWPIAKVHPSNPTLKVVGEVTEEAHRWMAEIRACEPNVNFVGYKPRLAEAYENSAIAVVPIDKNSGILNKAIEAMAAGVAVVGFFSAFEGMPHAEDGLHYLGCSSYAKLGRRIHQLLDDPNQRSSIAKAGRTLAAQHYAWPSKGNEYESMYLAAAQLAKA